MISHRESLSVPEPLILEICSKSLFFLSLSPTFKSNIDFKQPVACRRLLLSESGARVCVQEDRMSTFGDTKKTRSAQQDKDLKSRDKRTGLGQNNKVRGGMVEEDPLQMIRHHGAKSVGRSSAKTIPRTCPLGADTASRASVNSSLDIW